MALVKRHFKTKSVERREQSMRGAILLVFFLIFTSASLLIPSPMFPGNFFCALIGDTVTQYAAYLSAFFNGLFYGIILWLIFSTISKRFEEGK